MERDLRRGFVGVYIYDLDQRQGALTEKDIRVFSGKLNQRVKEALAKHPSS